MKTTGPQKQPLEKKYTLDEFKKLETFREQFKQYFQGDFDVELDENGNIALLRPEPRNEEQRINEDNNLNVALKKMFEKHDSFGMVSPVASKGLLKREFAITCPEARMSILGAVHIGSNVIIALHHTKTKMTAMAFIDPFTNFKDGIDLLLKKISDNTPNNIIINLLSGYTKRNILLTTIEKYIQSLNQSTNIFKKMQTYKKENGAIDAKGGLIYASFTDDLLEYEDRKLREACIEAQTNAYMDTKFPLTMIYDGSKEKPQELLFSEKAEKRLNKSRVKSVREAIQSMSLDENVSYKKQGKYVRNKLT